MALRETVGYMLKTLREQRQFSQVILARLSGYSLVYISMLERGERDASRVAIERLSDALQLDAHERVQLFRAWQEEYARRHLMPRSIPKPLTAILGREHEVTRARGAVLQESVRLLTITGPAGVGKTRLGLHLAAELEADFAEGVFFVDLTTVQETDLVFAAIARVLGLRESGKQTLINQIAQHVGERRMLWVLDNFEQIRDARLGIVALLKGCPRLVIIITSRVALRVVGEQLLRLKPLTVPNSQQQRAERQAVALLRRSDVRLLTVIGPEPISRLRLAYQIGNSAHQDFPGGSVFVDGTSLTSQTFVQALAQCVGITDAAEDLNAVITQFQAQPSLLILANLEGIPEVVTIFSDLLLSCNTLKIITTSHRRWHMSGERAVLAPSLASSDEAQLTSLRAALESPAITLFCQRASAIQTAFELTQTTAPVVIEICRRLDGLPLAIELVAARLAIFSPLQLLEKLTDFATLTAGDLLGDGPNDLPLRQRSLHTAIAWSYDLLDGEQQQVFQQIGLFAGGCTLLDLVEIYREHGVAAPRFEGVLETLVNSSLVQVEASDDGEVVRFCMLVTIREFATSMLQSTSDADAWRQAFAALYLHRVQELAPALVDRRQQQALVHITRQLENLREIMFWAARSAGDTTVGIRLAILLRRFWDTAGLLSEGRAWLQILLTSLDEHQQAVDPLLHAQALYVAGFLADLQWDFRVAKALLEKSQQIGEVWADSATVGHALARLGVIAVDEGHGDKGISLLKQSLAIWETLQASAEIATVYQHLGYAAMRRNDLETARMYYERSLPLQEAAGDLLAVGNIHNELGSAASLVGDFALALAHYQRSYQLFQQLQSDAKRAMVLNNLGNVAIDMGDYNGAGHSFQEALRLRQETRDEAGMALVLLNLAFVNILLGEFEQAYDYGVQGKAIALRLQHRARMAFAEKILAAIARECHQIETAREHYLACLDLLRVTPLLTFQIDCFNGLAELAADEDQVHMAIVCYAQASKLTQTHAIPAHRIFRAAQHQLQLQHLAQQVGTTMYEVAWQEGWQWEAEPFLHTLLQEQQSKSQEQQVSH